MAIRSFALALFAALSPAAQTESKCSVEGVVVQETTKEPVRRAEVMLYPSRPRGATARAPRPLGTLTDAEGKFRFTGLEPGEYTASVRKTGFLDARRSAIASPMLIKLAPGQEIKSLRYTLLPQAVIAGRIVDEEGEPLQGAQVQALPASAAQGGRQPTRSGAGGPTNDRGEFRLAGLSPGKYLLAVSMYDRGWTGPQQPGVQPTAYVITFYPGVTEPARAAQIEVAAGVELTGYDMQLKRAPVYRIQGKALDLNGEPLKEFSVSILPRDRSVYGMFGAAALTSGPAGDGTFESDRVVSGSYIVMVNQMSRSNPQERVSGWTAVDVGAQDVKDVVVRLQPPMTVSGTITIEGASGEKPALSALTVNLMAAPSSLPTIGFGGPGKVKEDGSFSVTVNGPGRYRLYAGAPRAQSTYVAAVRADGVDYPDGELDLTGGAPGPLKVVLRADMGKVTGRVERPDASQAGAAMVVVLPKDPPQRPGFMGVQTAQAAADGSFEIGPVRPGEYFVLAFEGSDSEFFQDEEQVRRLEGKATRVRVDPYGTASVQLKALPLPERQ